ncbi:apoptosis regulator BAX-like [Trichomycterus rosablanca]|uniref:apoptosis regulator BAX-like n=1 Tax=Trichomycterus rosablanca TaxID=2290929 RepID=UPI002F36085B
MDGERTTDYQIGQALLNRVVHNQIMAFSIDTSLSLPDTPVTDESSQKMVEELSKGIIIIGDRLNKDKLFNSLIHNLAAHADKKTFLLLVENVFSDGQINWGRIFILFYAVGRLAVKMLLSNLPTLVLDNVNLCLDFFRAKLLAWIHKMGGWISSISALAQFSLDSFSSSSICNIPVSAGLVVVFMSGILLGGLLVWKLNKST